MATTPSQNTTLSLPTRLLILLGPPSTVLVTSYLSPTAGLISPLAFAPTAYLYKKWRIASSNLPSRHAELELLLWTGLAIGTVGLASAAAIQLIMMKAATSLLFRNPAQADFFMNEVQRNTIAGLTSSELANRAILASSWQNWVFNFALTFAAAGLIEELLKFIPVLYAKYWYGKKSERRERSYIDFALAGTLGFGLVETLGFIYGTCMQPKQSYGKVLLLVFERGAGQFGHLSVAALSAVRATRRDLFSEDEKKKGSWWKALAPSVLYHGLSDFICLSSSALEGNVGFIHPEGRGLVVGMIAAVAAVWGVASWQMWREWKELDEMDRKAAEGKVLLGLEKDE